MANHYDIPSWAGKPPVGLHLDKLMIDEKKCYLFGRNPQMNDFCIDHASCSRVHSALVYHKHLNRAFLVDLGSTHGTFIGSIRIESNKPTQLPIDSTFHFGASTRQYIIRERPQTAPKPTAEEKEKSSDEIEGGLLGLPETETELDVNPKQKIVSPSQIGVIRLLIDSFRLNLTEFNTAHNRRISMLGIPDEESRTINRKRKKRGVSFNEDDEVINPEDIDPSVGKFRNLVQTTIIPAKKKRAEAHPLDPDLAFSSKHFAGLHYRNLYQDLPVAGDDPTTNLSLSFLFPSSLSGKLGLSVPNPAPEVDSIPQSMDLVQVVQQVPMEALLSTEPKKKKYAKEAWPGKKPVPSLLTFTISITVVNGTKQN
uniref:FHA domain-containing protein n=1 Tax=Strigamia maritima TaxID=126957 RepID=T1IRY4_STRMM